MLDNKDPIWKKSEPKKSGNRKVIIGSYKKNVIKKINWPELKYDSKGDKFRTSDLKTLVENIKYFLESMKKTSCKSLIIEYAGDYFGFDEIIKKCDKIIKAVDTKSLKIRQIYNLCGNEQEKGQGQGVYTLSSIAQHASRLKLLLKEIKENLKNKLEYITEKHNSYEKKFKKDDLAYKCNIVYNENNGDYDELIKDTKIKSSIGELGELTHNKVDFDKYDTEDILCFIGFVYHLDGLFAESISLCDSLNKSGLMNAHGDLFNYFNRKIKLKGGLYSYKGVEAFLKSTKKMLKDMVSIKGIKENGLFSEDECKKFTKGIMHKYKKGEAKKLLKDLKNTIEKNIKNSIKKAKKEFKNNKDGLSEKVFELGKIENEIYEKINKQIKELNKIEY